MITILGWIAAAWLGFALVRGLFQGAKQGAKELAIRHQQERLDKRRD